MGCPNGDAYKNRQLFLDIAKMLTKASNRFFSEGPFPPLKLYNPLYSVLEVALYTSLKLCGRATELPRSDFSRQVIRFTRHTLQVLSNLQS